MYERKRTASPIYLFVCAHGIRSLPVCQWLVGWYIHKQIEAARPRGRSRGQEDKTLRIYVYIHCHSLFTIYGTYTGIYLLRKKATFFKAKPNKKSKYYAIVVAVVVPIT